MRVALVGPPQSGKSTLLAAVAESGGSHVDTSRPDQSHLAVAKVPDERLDWLVQQYKPKKITPAELEFLDTPSFDLHDETTRNHARTHWLAVRQSQMILLVVRQFDEDTVPTYRNRIDPAADVEEIKIEMLFSDIEQVASRIEKLTDAIKKPTPRRNMQVRELDLMKRLAETLEAEKPISQVIHSEAEEKLIRSFSFLTQKPMRVVVNCSEGQTDNAPQRLSAMPCLALSAKIEEEIAQLPPEERQEFLIDLHLTGTVRDRLIRACYEAMHLVSFFTVGPDECRAWTIPAGTDAVTAAGQIHTDMARGFIRAETVAFDDFRAAGDMKAAKAAGKVRLEGKTYIVQDGDMILFRFNV